MSKSALPWYSIRARAQASAAEVFIYGDIGESWWEETITAATFCKEIAALDVSELTVRINSIGGSVPDGLAIYNALKRHKATVTISIDGMALSIASLIAMSGDSVEMSENAMLMIHAPWTYAAGNSVQLRELADQLDKWAEGMSTSYAAKTGSDQSEMLSLLTDGIDHYYTASEALASGFVDTVVSAIPTDAQASAGRVAVLAAARYQTLPAALRQQTSAAAAAQPQELSMTQQATNPAAAPATQTAAAAISAASAAPATAVNEAEISARAVAADAERRNSINALATGRVAQTEGVTALLATCANDIKCTVADAQTRLLAHLGKDAAPVAGAYVVEDGRDRFRLDATASILVRAGIQGDHAKDIRSNPMRGMKLLDLARECVERTGKSTRGMDQLQIVAAAFTTSGSDFPVLLENVMHKTLQTAYATAADTWTRFCSTGSVTDFRAHSRYRVGSIGNLDSLTELGEFKNKTIPDGEKASITATTKGNIINISRQTVINDDLQAFVSLAQALGRAGKRTIEQAVYDLLALNSGAGPTMGDGYALFASQHSNLAGSGGAPAVSTIDIGRQAMAAQKDVSGNEFLDLRPAIWLGPLSLGGSARVINQNEYDTEVSNKFQVANKVRGLFKDVVDSPRLSGTAWYMFADPNEAPTIEVAFLDGQTEPYVELQNGFDVDGAQWKVRLDFGVAAIDYKGGYRNPGA